MQHVVQQWWCDVTAFPSSPPQSPISHPAQPTHGSPPASGSEAKPTVGPKTTKVRADNARSAVARLPVLKRRNLTRLTIDSVNHTSNGAQRQRRWAPNPDPLTRRGFQVKSVASVVELTPACPYTLIRGIR